MSQPKPLKAGQGRPHLKLPKALKSCFQEPLKFTELLELGEKWSTLPLSKEQLSLVLSRCPKGSEWTLWMPLDVKTRFLELKQRLAPGLMHGEFVFLLMQLHIGVS